MARPRDPASEPRPDPPHQGGLSLARRRRDEKEPDLGFEVPPFDEGDFIRKETISFRTTLILFVYSLVTAFVSFAFWALVVQNWFASLLVGGVLGYLLRHIYPALKVDISHFKRKEWIGTGFLYFFSWLAFFIFLTNPPLYDGVGPTLDIHVTPDIQEAGGRVNITIIAADNAGLDPDTITFLVKDTAGTTLATERDLVRMPGPHAVWSWSTGTTADDEGTYDIEVSVKDRDASLLSTGARTTERSSSYTIGKAITVRTSGAGILGQPTDRVSVEIPRTIDVHMVRLLPTDGSPSIALAFDRDESDDDSTFWYAEPGFQGFKTGTTNFTVEAVEHDAYILPGRYGIDAPDAELRSAATYQVTITDETLLDDEVAKAVKRRPIGPAQTPGPEAVLLIAGIVVAAALIARRRRPETDA